jgi:hypothetical protein
MQSELKSQAQVIKYDETLKTVTYDLLDISVHYGDLNFRLIKEYRAYKLLNDRLQLEKNFGVAFNTSQNSVVFMYGHKDKCSLSYMKAQVQNFEYINFLKSQAPERVTDLIDNLS